MSGRLHEEEHKYEGIEYIALTSDELSRPAFHACTCRRTYIKWTKRAVFALVVGLIYGDLLWKGVNKLRSDSERRRHNKEMNRLAHQDYEMFFGAEEKDRFPVLPPLFHPTKVVSTCNIWASAPPASVPFFPLPHVEADQHEDIVQWASSWPSELGVSSESTHLMYNLDASAEHLIMGSSGPFSGHVNFKRDSNLAVEHVVLDVELPQGELLSIKHQDRMVDRNENSLRRRDTQHLKQPVVKLCTFKDSQDKAFAFGIAAGNSDYDFSTPPSNSNSRLSIQNSRWLSVPLNITVRLPPGRHHFHNLESRFGGMSLNIGDGVLSDKTFGHVSLVSSQAPISVKGVDANHILVASLNSSIGGTFTADYGLTLQTTRAPIDANVTLANHDKGYSSTIRMQNNLGSIKSVIRFIPSIDRGNNPNHLPAYETKVITQGSPINLVVAEQPVDAITHIEARSKYGGLVHVRLPQAYQGKVGLSTEGGSANVVAPTNVTDPTGRGRHREVDLTLPRKGHAEGTMKWLEKGRERGKNGGTSYVLLSSTHGGALELLA